MVEAQNSASRSLNLVEVTQRNHLCDTEYKLDQVTSDRSTKANHDIQVAEDGCWCCDNRDEKGAGSVACHVPGAAFDATSL